MSIVRRDGLVTEQAIRLDTVTGQISKIGDGGVKRTDSVPSSAPMFSEQLRYALDIASLERALGFQ